MDKNLFNFYKKLFKDKKEVIKNSFKSSLNNNIQLLKYKNNFILNKNFNYIKESNINCNNNLNNSKISDIYKYLNCANPGIEFTILIINIFNDLISKNNPILKYSKFKNNNIHKDSHNCSSFKSNKEDTNDNNKLISNNILVFDKNINLSIIKTDKEYNQIKLEKISKLIDQYLIYKLEEDKNTTNEIFGLRISKFLYFIDYIISPFNTLDNKNFYIEVCNEIVVRIIRFVNRKESDLTNKKNSQIYKNKNKKLINSSK